MSDAQRSLADRCYETHRMKRVQTMLHLVANGRHKQVLFPDEIFTAERSHNQHNDRILPRPCSANSSVVNLSHFPATVMVCQQPTRSITRNEFFEKSFYRGLSNTSVTTNGTCSCSDIFRGTVRRAVFGTLGQGRLALKFARSQACETETVSSKLETKLPWIS